jgi:hypothetical protein
MRFCGNNTNKENNEIAVFDGMENVLSMKIKLKKQSNENKKLLHIITTYCLLISVKALQLC